MAEPTHEQIIFMSLPLLRVLDWVHMKMEKQGEGRMDLTIPFKDCKFVISCIEEESKNE